MFLATVNSYFQIALEENKGTKFISEKWQVDGPFIMKKSNMIYNNIAMISKQKFASYEWSLSSLIFNCSLTYRNSQ